MTPIVVIGAGGHAAVIVEALRAGARFDPVAMVDAAPAAAAVLGVPIVGDDAALEGLRRQGLDSAVVAIGSNSLRQVLGDKASALGFNLPVIVHPSAIIAASAQIDDGAVIMARACIGARAEVGRLAVVNTGAIVEHDNRIGAAAHIAPGVALGGCVEVGERTLIGIGSTARPGSIIGGDTVVGAGAAVIGTIGSGVTAVGVPARPLASRPRA